MGIEKPKKKHKHCWHLKQGPIWAILPDGFVMQQCCQCDETKSIHRDHLTAPLEGREVDKSHRLGRAAGLREASGVMDQWASNSRQAKNQYLPNSPMHLALEMEAHSYDCAGALFSRRASELEAE